MPNSRGGTGGAKSASAGGRSGGAVGGRDNSKSGGTKKETARQVYSGSIGPSLGSGDPMGNAGKHFAQKDGGLLGGLDSLFGYENIGQRVQALKNNPSWAGNKTMTGIIPSFPWASPGYVVGSVFDALNTGPISFGLTMANALKGAVTGTTPEGMGQRVASALGATRGPQGPDVAGGGFERGGQGGNAQGGFLGLPNPSQPPGVLSQVPPGTSAPQPQTPPAGLLTMEYPGQTVPIGGPTTYNYYRPPYNYYGR